MDEKTKSIVGEMLLIAGILSVHEESIYEEGENILSEETVNRVEELVTKLDTYVSEFTNEELAPVVRSELATVMERLNKFIEKEEASK